MGWKCAMMVVSNIQDYDQQQLLTDLEAENYQEEGHEFLETAIFPEDKQFCIGQFEGNLIVTNKASMFSNLEVNLSNIERLLSKRYPTSEICTLGLHSVVNFWGYSVVKNGEKIRLKAGDSDSGTIFDLGEPFAEELELLAKSKKNDSGERIYIFDDFPDEPQTEDQVGEEFVFELSKRYFGERLDYSDDLFELKLAKFIPKPSPLNEKPVILETGKNRVGKKWWKFW